MSTTQAKLSRLIDTKTSIRQKLISLGVDVPSDTPFEQYPNLIKQVSSVKFKETTTDQDILQFVDLYHDLSTDDYIDHTYSDRELQEVHDLLDLLREGESDTEEIPKEVFDVMITFIGKTIYFAGDTFDPAGYIAKVVYTDGSAVDVKEDCVVTPNTPLTEEDDSITITYQLDGKTYTLVQPIKVVVHVPPLTVTREVLDQGEFHNVTPTYLTNQVDGSDGFTIVGRNSSSPGSAKYSGNLRWTISLDLSSWTTLSFYARKNNDHGMIIVGVEEDGSTEDLQYVRYSSGPTSWTKYTVNISNYIGVYTVYFIGGYVDSTGNTTSSTSYCNIVFS